jgi:hypothetical protein
LPIAVGILGDGHVTEVNQGGRSSGKLDFGDGVRLDLLGDALAGLTPDAALLHRDAIP